MIKALLTILLVVGVSMLYGCGESGPDWLRFGQRPAEVKEKPPTEQIRGTVLASASGRIITLEDFNARITAYNNEINASKDIPDSVKQNYLIQTKEDKKRLLDGMIERELLIAEALDRGLEKEDDLQEAIKALKEQLLFAKIIETERSKVGVSSQEVENYYNMYKDAFKIPEERRVSMVVVPSEDKAKEILIALLQGGDFGSLARANSTDESATKGGDIGFIVRQSPFPQQNKKTMFKAFEEVAFSLELNKPSTVFKGEKGFYIIKVTEIKQARQRMLSDVEQDIRQGLLMKKQEEVLQNLIGNLRKSGSIIVHDELL